MYLVEVDLLGGPKVEHDFGIFFYFISPLLAISQEQLFVIKHLNILKCNEAKLILCCLLFLLAFLLVRILAISLCKYVTVYCKGNCSLKVQTPTNIINRFSQKCYISQQTEQKCAILLVCIFKFKTSRYIFFKKFANKVRASTNKSNIQNSIVCTPANKYNIFY